MIFTFLSRCYRNVLFNQTKRYFSDNKSDDSNEDNRPYLSVLNILPPRNIKAFNTGSSIQKWSNKRPRIKSSKIQNKKCDKLTEQDIDSLDVSDLIKELEDQCPEEMKSDDSENTLEEIHPDIKRLLDEIEKREREDDTKQEQNISKKIGFEVNNNVSSDEKYKLRGTRKKKSKNTNKEKTKSGKGKNKLTKTVSFSLSKPPTPQTEQIIRVDVISNCSVEFATDRSKDDFMAAETVEILQDAAQNSVLKYDNAKDIIFEVFCIERPNVLEDLVLESKRAILFPRGAE